MKYSMLLVALLSSSTLFSQEVIQTIPVQENKVEMLSSQVKALEAKLGEYSEHSHSQTNDNEPLLEKNDTMLISVVGQGVAPMNTASPAQAYALAKRAATADAYRLIAEKVKGVRVDGQDVIKNMMVKRSTVRTSVNAMIRNANVVETTFKEGLCEVEMEIKLAYSQFAQ